MNTTLALLKKIAAHLDQTANEETPDDAPEDLLEEVEEVIERLEDSDGGEDDVEEEEHGDIEEVI